MIELTKHYRVPLSLQKPLANEEGPVKASIYRLWVGEFTGHIAVRTVDNTGRYGNAMIFTDDEARELRKALKLLLDEPIANEQLQDLDQIDEELSR